MVLVFVVDGGVEGGVFSGGCVLWLVIGVWLLAFEQAMYRVLARYYDYIYRFYVEHVAPRWAGFVAEKLRGVGARRVLDLACGTGAPTIHLVEEGFDVTCLDLNRPMLEVARGKPGLWLASLVEADATVLPFPSGAFDAATRFFSSIQYIGPFDKLVGFMREVRRVLRRGGLFIFDASNPLHVRGLNIQSRGIPRAQTESAYS